MKLGNAFIKYAKKITNYISYYLIIITHIFGS